MNHKIVPRGKPLIVTSKRVPQKLTPDLSTEGKAYKPPLSHAQEMTVEQLISMGKVEDAREIVSKSLLPTKKTKTPNTSKSKKIKKS
jgi:hypothetical protein